MSATSTPLRAVALDVGHSIPGQEYKFCNGAVTELTESSYLDELPQAVPSAIAAAARNAAHLARVMKIAHYPPYE
jgi:hypothetical protein